MTFTLNVHPGLNPSLSHEKLTWLFTFLFNLPTAGKGMNLCTKSLVVGLKRLALWIKTFNPTWRWTRHRWYDQTLCVWKASTENLEFRALSFKGDEQSTRTATTRLKHTSIRKRITGRKWTKIMGNVFKHLMNVTLQCFNISDWCIQKAIFAQITHHHATSSSSSL